jgi:hypothetical protein
MGKRAPQESFMPGPDDVHFKTKQQVQIALMRMAGGTGNALDWIAANAERLKEILENPEGNFMARLESPATHDEALEEIKRRLYH